MGLKLKKYESKVLEILDDGSAIIELPIQMCKELGWNVDDVLTLTTEDDIILLKKKNGC